MEHRHFRTVMIIGCLFLAISCKNITQKNHQSNEESDDIVIINDDYLEIELRLLDKISIIKQANDEAYNLVFNENQGVRAVIINDIDMIFINNDKNELWISTKLSKTYNKYYKVNISNSEAIYISDGITKYEIPLSSFEKETKQLAPLDYRIK